MPDRPRKTITLTELGILIVIFAILRSVVVPVLTQAADSRDSTLRVELQRLQGAIDSYRQEHRGRWPRGDNITAQLTMRTNELGEVLVEPQASGPRALGPYIQRIPRNPYVNRRVADRIEAGVGEPGGGNVGWYYNETTGVISPDDDFHRKE